MTHQHRHAQPLINKLPIDSNVPGLATDRQRALNRQDVRVAGGAVGSVRSVDVPLISQLAVVAELARAVLQHRPALMLRHLAVDSIVG